MGSWNHTCAITNLPIMVGDEVEVILLKTTTEGKVDDSSFCYPGTYHQPIPLTFHGKYDDYGRVEECEGAALNVIIEALRKELVEMDVGENKYHDIEVKKKDFDVDYLFRVDHEGRLYIRNHLRIWPDSPQSVRVKHIVIRKEVYDAITERTTLYRCKFDPYVQYNLALADLDKDEFTTGIDDYNALEEDAIGRILNRHPELGGGDISDLLAYKSQGVYGMAHPIDVVNTLREVRIDQPELYDGLLDNALRFAMFNHFMHAARKSWVVPSGAGSQDSESTSQELCAELTLSSAEAIRKRWDDYEE